MSERSIIVPDDVRQSRTKARVLDGRDELGDKNGLIASEVGRDHASLPIHDELRAVRLRLVFGLEVDVRDGKEQSEDVGCSRIVAFVLLRGSGLVKTSQTPAVNFVAASYGRFDIYRCEIIAGNHHCGSLGFAVFRMRRFPCHARSTFQCAARCRSLIL